MNGEIHVFHETLKVYEAGSLRAARLYQKVALIKSDVDKLVEEIAEAALSAPFTSPEPNLKWATDLIIHKAIADVYDAADNGAIRPNINQLPAEVHPRLKAIGHRTTRDKIREIAKRPEFVARRRESGTGRWGGT